MDFDVIVLVILKVVPRISFLLVFTIIVVVWILTEVECLLKFGRKVLPKIALNPKQSVAVDSTW